MPIYTILTQPTTCTPIHLLPTLSYQKFLHNPIRNLGDKEARYAKDQKPSSQTPEPGEIAFIFLTWYPNVHTPQPSDNIHGKNNGTEYSKFTEYIGGLLLSLVHANINLSEVVTMRTCQDPVYLLTHVSATGWR
jgi:hypothetical protein